MTLQNCSGLGMCGTGKMKIDIETEKGHLRSGRSTRPSGCMTLQIGWLHGGANWHPEVPRAPFAAPRATLRTREGAMLTPRDALPIRWDALPIPEEALRVRRASPGRLGDALLVLRAWRRPRSRPVRTLRGASRARSGAVRVRSDTSRMARTADARAARRARPYKVECAPWREGRR